MGETTLQDRRAAAAAAGGHATNKYTSLKETALAFIDAQACNASLSSKMDFSALGQMVAPSYSHAFGPRYTVSAAPNLQGSFSIESFVEHLGRMIANLEAWHVEVRGCVVDEVGESVVLRASYRVQVKGAEEVVENDVVWWLELEEGGSGSEIGEGNHGDGGWKVRKSTEMVDAGAVGRIRELIVRTKGQAARKDSAAVAE